MTVEKREGGTRTMEEKRDEGDGVVLIVPPHAVEPCHVKGKTMMKVSLNMTANEVILAMMMQKGSGKAVACYDGEESS